MLAGLVGAHEDLVAVRLAGESDPFTRLLLLRLADSALWAALSAPVLLLSARLAASGTRLAARLAAHVFAAVAVAGAHVLLVRVLGVLPQDVPTPFLIAIFLTDLCIYGAIAALGHGWGTHRLAAAEELETARLQGELAAAELEALGWELEPEFLLSALEAIGELAATDAARADELTAQTGELLRLVLAGHGVSEVPLAREIDLLRAHLAVQTAVEPPGTRLGVAIEPGADLAPVPPMLLAPLAGVLGHDVGSGERCLALRASRAGDELVLALRAPSLSEEAVLRPFGALAAIRGRLAALHGPAARCDVSGENGAHTITIRLPWRRAGAARAREVA
jgi:hypothetical protein